MHKMVISAAVAGLLAAAFTSPASAADVVTAVQVVKPPVLAAGAADPVWAKAKALTVPLSGGVNFKNGKGSTTATLKAVYSGDMLYVLLQYDDPTQSVRRFPYQKQADGSWKKLTDPKDKGGDDNVYYEDKFALIWNIGNSIKGFDKQGCMAACHAGEPGKPFGNKYTASEGELGDIWHMKSIRTGYIGQVDDQYLDHTRFDPQKAPEAGRKSDPKTAGGYTDVKLVNGKPEFMHKSGLPAKPPSKRTRSRACGKAVRSLANRRRSRPIVPRAVGSFAALRQKAGERKNRSWNVLRVIGVFRCPRTRLLPSSSHGRSFCWLKPGRSPTFTPPPSITPENSTAIRSNRRTCGR